ncbi:hypothetical protein ZWY2020_033646 [Hordeum vulgare]|nr:hypothetical protein ZWY2020_033646 [Hordeum vulgare]
MPSTESAAGLRTSEFALPDGVLAVLSWDPYEQLDVARRITALAVAGWVTGLECEVARLREGAADREQENVEPWDVESTEVAGPGHAGANTLITSARNIWSTRSRSILNEPKSSAIIGSHNVNLHDLAIGRRRFFSRSVMPSSSLWWSPFSSPLHYLSY